METSETTFFSSSQSEDCTLEGLGGEREGGERRKGGRGEGLGGERRKGGRGEGLGGERRNGGRGEGLGGEREGRERRGIGGDE